MQKVIRNLGLMLRRFGDVSRPKNVVKHTVIVMAILLSLSFYLREASRKGPENNGFLEIIFLDVGQGDSILVKSIDASYMLIDAGPDDSVIEQLGNVLPSGFKGFDIVLLTHPDMDHVGGLPDVLNKYNVEQLYFANVDSTNTSFDEVKKYSKKNPNVYKGDLKYPFELTLGCCAEIDILWPDKQIDYSDNVDINDISVATRISYGKFVALMSGDLSIEYEELMAVRNPMNIDLLKISHHGSKTSSSELFLNLIDPEIAVVSVGEENKFGHPDQSVVERIGDKTDVLLDTSKRGNIKIVTDGNRIWFPEP